MSGVDKASSLTYKYPYISQESGMDINRESVAWAAGLFEGEGSIVWCSLKNRNPKLEPWRVCQLSLHSTDEDVVRRFASVIGIGKVYGPYRYPTREVPNRKPSWYWGVQNFERCQFVLALLWPWLCNRRRNKALEVLRLELQERPAGHNRRDKKSGRFQ